MFQSVRPQSDPTPGKIDGILRNTLQQIMNRKDLVKIGRQLNKSHRDFDEMFKLYFFEWEAKRTTLFFLIQPKKNGPMFRLRHGNITGLFACCTDNCKATIYAVFVDHVLYGAIGVEEHNHWFE